MKIHSEQEMLDFGKTFATKLQDHDHLNAIIELIGDVGAGKTTFTRGLAAGLGITAPVTSPSFTISKSYAFQNKNYHPHTLTHYDFYRLEDPGLMRDQLHESIKNGDLVIVEWANTVQNLLPNNHITITISLNDDGSRNIEISERQSQTSLIPSATDVEQTEQLDPITLSDAKKHAEKKFTSSSVVLFLDTSTPTTILKINDHTYTSEFGNTLSEKLLQFIHEKLQENHQDWHDIKSITFMSGPGSFTGLRIGASVVNTLAHELNIPLYDHHGNRHPIILPDYGREANITNPKK